MKYERLTDKNDLYRALQETKLSAEVGIYLTDCLNRLAELEDKIENGTLIELPCKVGDTVYCVYSPPYPADPNDKGKWFMGEFEVAGFYYGIKGLSIKIYCYGNVNKKELGKTVFLTREEAEKKLEELDK